MATLKVTNIKNESFAGDQLYLKTDGTIGIGTTSPEDLLHIKTGKIRIENAIVSNNDSTISYDNDTFLVDVDPNNVRGSSKFQIKVDTVAGLTIDDNRRVGIGTASPTNKVSLVGSDSGDTYLQIANSTTGSDANSGFLVGLKSDEGATLYQLEDNYMRFGTNGAERLRIAANGEINTTDDFQIGTQSQHSKELRFADSTRDDASCIWVDNSTSSDLLITNDRASGAIRLSTNSAERFRITSAGKVLIGNTASNTMWGYGQGGLQLTGNWDEASASFINDENNSNSHAITLAKIRGSSIVQNGDFCGSIAWNGYDGSAYKATARIHAAVDGTPGAGDMPGRLVFETVNDGGSTPIERYRISSDGTHTWGYPMVFAFAPATTQSLTDATWTKNTWLTGEDIDTNSAFASSTFTVPADKAGKYYVSAGNNLYGNDNNIRNARTAIYKNGSIYARAHSIVMSTTSSALRHLQCVTSCILDLAVGDTIENYMYLDVESGLLYMSSDNDTVRANFLLIYRIG